MYVWACVTSFDTIYYGVPLWTIFGDELSVRCWVVGASFRLRSSKIDVSTFEDRCVDFRKSMCRPSEIDVLTVEDRCVDLWRSMISVDLRRSCVG